MQTRSSGQAVEKLVVWAPKAKSVDAHLDGRAPQRLETENDGYFSAAIPGAKHGDRYRLSVDGGPEVPDPRSRWQPEGAAGPSAFVDPSRWIWTDQSWPGLSPENPQVIYELHIATFTPGGTFDSAIGELARLAALGITAVEVMPVSQFSGERNWGYDGVFPWSVQNSYGGPDALARFVDAAHQLNVGVLLDVVYNHLGPEGNVLAAFGPYFTDRYSTWWGPALNFDGRESDEVRRYFIDSARAFVADYHIDGFRLDAVHAIVDTTARPFLAQFTDEVDGLLIAETAANDERTLRPTADGGHGFTMQWNDDFHHALRVALTGEKQEYYRDFNGAKDLAKSLNDRFVYTGQHSDNHGRAHGSQVEHHRADRFVVFSTNHDHIGNRAEGDRLDLSVTVEQRRLAAAAVLLSPFTPMLFMGEEYGERRPFPYFVSHESDELIEAVRQGRTAEFADQDWSTVPDPADPDTMASAVLKPNEANEQLVSLYQDLLGLRASDRRITDPQIAGSAVENDGVVSYRREDLTIVFNFSSVPAAAPTGSLIFSSKSDGTPDPGSVAPWSAAVFDQT